MKRKHPKRLKKPLKSGEKSSDEAIIKSPGPSPAQDNAVEDFESRFLNYFSDKERVAHDIQIEHVTNDRFRSAQEFARACEAVGVWRLKQRAITDAAGFFLGELAIEMAHGIRNLIERGDLMLARRLPVIVEILDSAFYVYGPRLTSRITKTASIHNLLKQHKAKELLAMLSALHPDWHTFILHIYDPKVRELPEEQQHEIRLRKRRCIEAFPENRLRKYILSKELFVGWKGNKPTKEWRRHGLAEILENMFTLRDGQRENINLFVEHLFHGRLWSLSRGETDSQPGKTYVDCPWKGRGDNPPRKDVRAWMKIVMPFLEAQTGGDMKQRGDPMRLAVFERLLSTRKGRHEPGDLNNEFHPVALGSRTLAWNYLRGELADAWTRMTKRAIKLKSGKPA